jgi:predicted PurR-regulated permease PerM
VGRTVEGLGVLLLLSVFLAYLSAPAAAAIRRRILIGRRKRPLSRPAALALLYCIVFAPTIAAGRLTADGIAHWVHVTAPAAVDHLFSGARAEPFETVIARAPISDAARLSLRRSVGRGVGYVEREVRSTLHDLIAAAPYARWLAVTPALAFVLLTSAPAFQRSTLRVLPHGHLQWRGEEYLRDVNSALAGYVRAQTAAAIIVGIVCVAGFATLRVPNAVSMGVTAGVLELVPAIGPLAAALMAITQAGDGVWAALFFLGALRIVQDYVVYPHLVRRGMHLSTAAVILTIWIGAVLAGAAGVVLAIPVAGFLSVSVRHWREYHDIERLVAASRKNSDAAGGRQPTFDDAVHDGRTSVEPSTIESERSTVDS